MLQHRPQGALDYEDRAAALEEKPAAKALSGMTLRPLIAAEKAGPTGAHAFSAAFAAELARLPYESVQAEIKTTRSRLETLSPATLEGMAASVIDPAARAGRISKELALQLVNMSFALGGVLPRAGAVSSEALVAQPRLDGPNLRPLGYEDSPTVGSSRENPTRRGFIGSRCR